jgi:hypothetical protein
MEGLFIYYNAPPRAGGPTATTTWNNLARFSEFHISADPNVVDIILKGLSSNR